MTDELKTLMEQAGVSEDTVEHLQSLIESAVQEKTESLEEVIKDLEASHAQTVAELMEKSEAQRQELTQKGQEYGEYIQAQLMEKMDDYAHYAMQEFIKENKERFVETEQFLRMQAVFEAVKTAFEDNGFSLDENKELDQASRQLEESTELLDKAMASLKTLEEERNELVRKITLMEKTADLTVTQVEKVKELVEALSFENNDEFERGVDLIIEQVVTHKDTKPADELNESVKALEVKNRDVRVQGYVEVLRRLSR